MSVNSDTLGSSKTFSSFDLNVEKSHFQGISRGEFGGMGSDNVVDSLPVDPFGMDVKSAVAAMWFENSDVDFGQSFSKFGTGETEGSIADGLIVGMDWFLDGTVKLQPRNGDFNVGSISTVQDCHLNGDFNGGFDSKRYTGNGVAFDKGKVLQGNGGDPHDGLFLALRYLGVKDLLVVERVCRSLRDAVRGDSLLWRNIHIDQPLSAKITDKPLMKLTSRAQGTLECLSLMGCFRITDNGLSTVIDNNPRLTKLSVPGCARLTIDSILFNLKALRSAGSLRIKHLRIGRLFGVTESQLEELKFLLGADNQRQASTPRFHRVGELYLSHDDDRAIDIEMCPRCHKPGLVYDCPLESCQGNDQAKRSCRACSLCIARCVGCGRCIDDSNYEETFYLDFLCLVCLKQLVSCQEKAGGVKHTSSHRHAIFHHKMSYEHCLYG